MLSRHESGVDKEQDGFVDVFDFIEQTAERARQFYNNDSLMRAVGIEPHPTINTQEFDSLMQMSAAVLSRYFHDAGGIRVAYVDEVTEQPVTAFLFGCAGYNPVSQKWNMVATQNGMPPVDNQPVLAISFLTDELRKSHEQSKIF